jgi:hypothetical protein
MAMIPLAMGLLSLIAIAAMAYLAADEPRPRVPRRLITLSGQPMAAASSGGSIQAPFDG